MLPRAILSYQHAGNILLKRTRFSTKRGVRDSAFWTWTTQSRPSWKENKKEALIVCCVFAITGSTSVGLVRPALKRLGIEGTLWDGPNSYRLLSVIAVSPIYACILLLTVRLLVTFEIVLYWPFVSIKFVGNTSGTTPILCINVNKDIWTVHAKGFKK